MEYEWDEAKAGANETKHGVSFSEIHDFDWSVAMVIEDNREDYGERRYIAYGPINGRLHVAVITPRGEGVRLIGLRKANKREVAAYGQEK